MSFSSISELDPAARLYRAANEFRRKANEMLGDDEGQDTLHLGSFLVSRKEPNRLVLQTSLSDNDLAAEFVCHQRGTTDVISSDNKIVSLDALPPQELHSVLGLTSSVLEIMNNVQITQIDS